MDFAAQYGPWAIVAGASEGIGRSFARSLAERGVSCILVALDGPLDEGAAEVRAHGVEAVTARIDLAAPDAFERIVEAAGGREVGLYVANAGGDANASRYLDIEADKWLRLARINIMTTMQACHHFGRQMRERKRGGLLIVNSGGCYGGGSFLVTYNAAKAFLLNFAEGLWAELRPHGVDVLTIALNVTDTPNLHRILAKTAAPLPEGAASPDDVAEVALTQLPDGPVQNWGLAEDDAGFGASAAERRARVLAMDAGASRIYGELGEQILTRPAAAGE
jgi:short-subunit dehydrogenase